MLLEALDNVSIRRNKSVCVFIVYNRTRQIGYQLT